MVDQFIAIDMGNSTCELALFNNGNIVNKKFFSSNPFDFKSLSEILNFWKIRHCLFVISSVVPSKNEDLVAYLQNYHNGNVCLITHDMFPNSIVKKGVEKGEVGIDILCKALWSKEMIKESTLILDMGTATVLQYMDDDLKLNGASISIGYGTIFKSLGAFTDLLSPTNQLTKSPKILGHNTQSALGGGVYWGYVGIINSFISKSMEETNCKNIYITGGNSNIFLDDINMGFKHDKNLIFYGIKLIKECYIK